MFSYSIYISVKRSRVSVGKVGRTALSSSADLRAPPATGCHLSTCIGSDSPAQVVHVLTRILCFTSPFLYTVPDFTPPLSNVNQIGEAPYFGQFGHFTRYAPVKIDYAVQRSESYLGYYNHAKLEGRSKRGTQASYAPTPLETDVDVFPRASSKLRIE